jgi:hypothetical protein
MVSIRFSGQNYHVGYFKSLVDARIERNVALNKVFGEGGLTKAWPQKEKARQKTRYEILIEERRNSMNPSFNLRNRSSSPETAPDDSTTQSSGLDIMNLLGKRGEEKQI